MSDRILLLVAAALAFGGGRPVSAASLPKTEGPVKVELRSSGPRFELFVNGAPFFVKGAGLEFGNPESLAAHGGNSFRTWRTENGRASGRAVLDRALTNGLYVTMGLELEPERHGFDYGDHAAVARQFESLRGEVLKYKDHPALIIWCIGNELNLDAKNPAVWNAVNDLSKMIHQLDTNHLTMTALAGLNPQTVRDLKTRAPDLDLIGIQMYADIVNLPRRLRESGWDGPYLVTEWGATGHWEVGRTPWGAPLENDSTTKAKFYRQRYEASISADPGHCLGSYVFLWEQKQERTPTWYGMFLETGEETETVDVMHRIWNGAWPANRSPQISGLWCDGKTPEAGVRLRPGQKCNARTQVDDPDHDALTYSWEILEESASSKTGGDAETRPADVSGLIPDPNHNEIQLTAPSKPGAYRLFLYARDGHGHAAHANLPFFVEASGSSVSDSPAQAANR